MLDLKAVRATIGTSTGSTRRLTTSTSSILPTASRRSTSKINGKTSGKMRAPRIEQANNRRRRSKAPLKKRLNLSIVTMNSVAATLHTRGLNTRGRKGIPQQMALKVAGGVRSKRKRMSIIGSTIKSSTVRHRLRQRTRVCLIASSVPGFGESLSPRITRSMSRRWTASSTN
jgi:hypothetical protein